MYTFFSCVHVFTAPLLTFWADFPDAWRENATSWLFLYCVCFPELPGQTYLDVWRNKTVLIFRRWYDITREESRTKNDEVVVVSCSNIVTLVEQDDGKWRYLRMNWESCQKSRWSSRRAYLKKIRWWNKLPKEILPLKFAMKRLGWNSKNRLWV